MLRRTVVLVALLAGLLPGVAWPSQPVWAARLGGAHAAATGTAPSALVGSWMNGTVSLTTYRSVATGEFAPTSGTGELYSVSAAGHYEWVRVSQESVYACTSLIASDNEGTLTVGSTGIVLTPKSNVEIGRFSCQRKQDYDKKLALTSQVYQWRSDSYQRGTKLCLLGQATKAKTDCLWSEEKRPDIGDDREHGQRRRQVGQPRRAHARRPCRRQLWRWRQLLGRRVQVPMSFRKRVRHRCVSTADGGATWSSRLYTNSGVTRAGRELFGYGPVRDGGRRDSGPPSREAPAWRWTTRQALPPSTASAVRAPAFAWPWERTVTCLPVRTAAPAGRAGHLATRNTLYAVSCPSSGLCVAVGEEGTIVTSTDGGATWTSRTSGTDFDLDGVACPSTSACMAVGGATILVSTNGGASWSKANQPAGTYASLKASPAQPAAPAWRWAATVPSWPARTAATSGPAARRARAPTCTR